VVMKAGMALARGCCRPSPSWLMLMVRLGAGSSVVLVSRHMRELVISVKACVIWLSQQ
jgi:hypothetical protein